MVLRRTMAIATTSPTNKTMMENVVIASTRGAESAAGAAGGERVLGELGGLIGVVAVGRLFEKIAHGTPHTGFFLRLLPESRRRRNLFVYISD